MKFGAIISIKLYITTSLSNDLDNINVNLGVCASLSTNKRTTIPDNTDLDNLIAPGQYKVGTQSKAKTIANIPVQGAGILDVLTNTSASNTTQIYTLASPTTQGMYIRNRASNGTWGDWKKLINSDDFSSTSKLKNSEYIAIERDTDLNDIITPGIYKSTSSSVTATLINAPFNIGFNLRVFNVIDSQTVYQMALVASDTASIKVRFINPSNNTYGEWKAVSANIDGDMLLSAIGEVGSTAASNTSRILDLETAAGITGGYYTPYAEQEQAFYNKINNDIDKNTLVFLISTDNHYRETVAAGEHQVEFAEVMAKMAKRLRCDAIINLGDIITQYIDTIDDEVYANTDVTPEEVNTMRLAKMATAFQSTGVPFLYTIAHHEMGLHTNASVTTNNQTQTNTYPYPENKVLGICGKGAEWLEEHHYSQDPLSSGYYVDFPRHKVRLISIDSVSFTLTGFSPASIAFITEAFSNVPSGYKVIVLSHVASRYPGVYSSNPNNGEQVETIMQNYVSGGGTILAYIHGHSHFDNVVTINGVPYPYVCICCAENSWSTVGEKIEAGVLGNPVSYRDHAASKGAIGTYNEYLFDVACVHPDRNTINFFRFGIGEDRTVALVTS